VLPLIRGERTRCELILGDPGWAGLPEFTRDQGEKIVEKIEEQIYLG